MSNAQDKQDAAMWRALVRDTDAQPCAHPALRDDLADWLADKQPSTQAAEAPPPCDSEIHKNGAVVAVMECGMIAMEGLVQEANRIAPGMDWHYFGGRAVVKTLGDVKAARAALERAMPRFLAMPAGSGQ